MKNFVTRVYLEGWNPATDFAVIKPNHILVEPLRPDAETATKGGILLPGKQVGDIPGVSAFLYRVIARGDVVGAGHNIEQPALGAPVFVLHKDEAWMVVAAGEVITLRNALVDPIHVNQKQLLIHDKHVLTLIDPAAMADVAPSPPKPTPPTYQPMVGDRVKALTREGVVVELRGKGCAVLLDGDADEAGPTLWSNDELTLVTPDLSEGVCGTCRSPVSVGCLCPPSSEAA